MKPARSVSRLAVMLAVAAATALVIAANVHLVYVALASQPTCIAAEPGLAPARKLC